MQPNIAQNRTEIADICRKYDVRRMEAYDPSGTGLGSPEGPVEVGFLVIFNGDEEPFEQFGYMLKMEDELKSLLQKRVHVGERGAIYQNQNQSFRARVEDRLERVYG